MTAPRLSVCIATLNRATFLGEMLDSLISQVTAGGFDSQVEVVVIDGASTDDTEQVLRDRQARFAHLRYRRLEAKGGVDLDYCRAVEMAEGEYCWLMSDDDLLKPGAVAAVLEASQNSYSLIVVNAEVRDADLSTVLHPTCLPFTTDQVYPSAEHARLLTDLANYMSFIGSVVIRREVWNARQTEPYLGTEFIHLGVIFQSALPAATRVLAAAHIIIRYGNASWSGRSFETWLFKWPQLIWSFTDLPAAAKAQVTPEEPWRNPRFLLIYRAKGVLTPEIYQRWLAPRMIRVGERLSAWFAAHLPGCVINAMVMAYFSLVRPQFKTLQADMRASPYYFRRCLSRLRKPTINA